MKKQLTLILLLCCSLISIKAQRILDWSIGDVSISCGATTQICYQVQVAIDDASNSPELATSTIRLFYDAGLLENLSISNIQSDYSISGLNLSNDVYGGVFGFSGGNGGVYASFNLDAPTNAAALDLGTSSMHVFDLCFDVIENSTYPLCTPIVFDNNHLGWGDGINADDSYLSNNAGIVGTYYLSGIYTTVELADDEVTNYLWQENPLFDGEVDNLADDVGSTITTACIEDVCNSEITLVKTSQLNLGVDNKVGVGDLITYTYTVTNSGSATLYDVTVDEDNGTFTGTNPAPTPGAETITSNGGSSSDASTDGKIDVLAPGDEATFEATYAITQEDINAGSVTNQATVTGTPGFGYDPVMDLSDDGNAMNGDDDPTITSVPQNPLIAVIKEGVFQDEDNDTFAQAGETIDYTFTVTNEGNVSLDNVSLSDPLLEAPNMVVNINGPSGDTGSDGVLGLTETWTYTATYTITQADIDAGSVMNQATVRGESPLDVEISDLSDDNNPAEDDVTETPVPQNPAIAVIKEGVFQDEDNDNYAQAGETIDYTFTVTNEGNVPLDNVSLSDPLLEAPNMVVNISGPSGDTGSDGVLGLTETWTYTATYTITQADIDAGSVMNQATVRGESPVDVEVSDLSDDNNPAEDDVTETPVPQNPVIAVIKVGVFQDEDNDTYAQVGETIDYTFTVTNEGNVPLDNVSLSDPLLEAPNPVVSISGPSGDTGSDGVLGLTETWTYTATYTITQADINTGGVINQATVTGDDTGGNPVTDLSDDNSPFEDDPTTTIVPRDVGIAIVKEGVFQDEDNDTYAQVGETIDYTFTVTNEGNIPLDNVSLSDPLLEAPNMVVNISGPSGDTGSDGVLGLTETWTYTATYTITQADIDAGSVMNQATVTGDDTEGNPVTDLSDDNSPFEDDVTETPVPQSPALSVIKSVTNTSGNRGVGEVITYAIEVTNTGNTSISDIEILDVNATLVSGNPIVLLTPGQSATVTATHTITQGDVDQGYVQNTATATGDSPQGTDDVSDVSDTGTDPFENPISDPETVETPDGEGMTDGNPANDPTVTQLFTQLNVFVNLEGSLVNPQGGGYSLPMRTTLNDSRLLPGQFNENAFEGDKYIPVLGAEGQAYNILPWYYSGSEGDSYDSQSMSANADANYPSTVVDWVLVSIRLTPKDGSEVLCQTAGLLHEDGSITFPPDADRCTLDYKESYYFVIEHRNHLISMSAEAMPIVAGEMTYDFRNQQSYIDDFLETGLPVGQKEIFPGVFAMYAGNGDQSTNVSADTDISGSDITLLQNGSPDSRVYSIADYNMDGEISALDLALLLLNNPRFTSVPRN